MCEFLLEYNCWAEVEFTEMGYMNFCVQLAGCKSLRVFLDKINI